MLMGTDHGAIDEMGGPINLTTRLSLLLQGG
jgi:hypothetical protein